MPLQSSVGRAQTRSSVGEALLARDGAAQPVDASHSFSSNGRPAISFALDVGERDDLVVEAGDGDLPVVVVERSRSCARAR